MTKRRAPKGAKPIKRCIYLDRSVLAEIQRLADLFKRTLSSEGLWLLSLGLQAKKHLPDLPEPFLDEGLATAYLYMPPPMAREIENLFASLNKRAKARITTRVAGTRTAPLAGGPAWSVSCVIRYLLEAGLHVEHWIEGLLTRKVRSRAIRNAEGSPRACALALLHDHTAEELATMAERPARDEFLVRWNLDAADATEAVRVAFSARLQLEELLDVPPPADCGGEGAAEES